MKQISVVVLLLLADSSQAVSLHALQQSFATTKALARWKDVYPGEITDVNLLDTIDSAYDNVFDTMTTQLSSNYIDVYGQQHMA